MAKWMKWQRGSADLLSVAMGAMILAVVTAGTSSAMIYGREMLLREEHYKAAAYLLRGEMEAQQTALQIDQGQNDLMAKVVRSAPLDLSTDRNNVNVREVQCTISRSKVEEVSSLAIGVRIAYYRVTMKAAWLERDLAESTRDSRILREISFTTCTLPRKLL
jgi:hypothetical protein